MRFDQSSPVNSVSGGSPERDGVVVVGVVLVVVGVVGVAGQYFPFLILDVNISTKDLNSVQNV